MISFYPGPSKVYPQIPDYVCDAYEQGVLSINHRSAEFVAISSRAIQLMKEKLDVPADYTVFFTSSSTECWEIISQSLVEQASFHIYNGAFGEKWYQYAQKLQPEAKGYAFDLQETLTVDTLEIPNQTELVALTHNETSNGTALSHETLRVMRQRFPEPLIAIDATSSLAGVAVPIEQADIWYASVQKCFGLPAGLAVMLCSPRVIARAEQIGENQHYNSLLFMNEKIQVQQTTYTPNVLAIYLLMRTLEARTHITNIDHLLRQRFQRWIEVISQQNDIQLLIANPAVRSLTVIPFTAEKTVIDGIRQAAKEQGIILGNGYGPWKENSLRIANFPALEEYEIARLINFLTAYSPS